jgi:hypothetical protein
MTLLAHHLDAKKSRGQSRNMAQPLSTMAAATTTTITTMAGTTAMPILHKPTSTTTSVPQHAAIVVVACMVVVLLLVTRALPVLGDHPHQQQQQQLMTDEYTNDESSSSSLSAPALAMTRSLLNEMENEQDESSSSSSSSHSDFPWQAKAWFTLIVCGVACWDMAVLLVLNASLWRPRWEARFLRYVHEGSAVLGYCHAVKAIQKTVVCGYVWNDKYRPPPSSSSSSSSSGPGSPSKYKHHHYFNNTNSTHTSAASEEDDPSSSAVHTSSCSDAAIGSRPKAQNRQMSIVEYQITIRYKFEGVRVEKVMMLKAGQHDSILPTTGNAVNLLVLPGEATSALFTSHVYLEVSQPHYYCSSLSNEQQSLQQEQPQPPEQQQSYSPHHSQHHQQQQPCCKRVFGIYGGTPGWIWGIFWLLLGILLPLWPFLGIRRDDENDDDENNEKEEEQTVANNDMSMWTRVGIVLVANVLILVLIVYNDFGNRHHGYPNQFREHLGTAKKKSFQWK